MEWRELYPPDNPPGIEEISARVASPLWSELCAFAEKLSSPPRMEYSKCSSAPGWNMKYKKGGRSLCTLYPREGGFACMVVIGAREQSRAELLLTTCDPSIQELYERINACNGAHWLMIDVTSPKILEDVKALMTLRLKPV